MAIVVVTSSARSQDFVPLWPEGKMPNSKGLDLEHKEENERITQVETPGFHSFMPAKEEKSSAAVLILPGGGYHHLTYDLGGYQIAKWFNTMGISAFVLDYRLPTSPDLKIRQNGPVQDAQRAMKLLRANAEKYNIDVNKIGVFATSAGGHLASTLGTHSEDFSVIENDSISDLTFKPDFMLLISPVISFGEFTHQGSRDNFLGENPSEEMIRKYSNEFQVTAETPPTFLVHAQNDEAVPPKNSLLFYEAMLEHKVEGSLHIFPQGKHAIGILNNSELTDEWKVLAEKWLKERRIIE